MKFRLEFDCDGEAFADGARGPEIARVLRAVASDIDVCTHARPQRLLIYNHGVIIGRWSLEEGESAEYVVATNAIDTKG